MAKKAHPHRSGQVRTLHDVRSPGAEFARLRGEFSAWLRDAGLPTCLDPRALADDVATMVDRAAERGLVHLHRWAPDDVERLAESTDPATLTTLPVVLAFLADTGRWSGTQEEFDEVLAAAEDAASPVGELVGELDAVEVDPALEEEAVRRLPLVGQAEELLRFLRPGRRVTVRGALGRADVGAALRLLGIRRDTPPRSMWDVPRLATLWEALLDADMLVLRSRTVLPTPLANAWLDGDPEPGATARRQVAEALLLGLLDVLPDTPWSPDPVDALLPALAGAALDRPLAVEDLGGPPELRALLGELVAEGLLDGGSPVTTAPGLRGVLARCTAQVLSAELTDGPAPPDPDLAGQAWTLRVELADADPPVWREVLVDPNSTLDELHDVLQAVFGWEDHHLHDFVTVDSRRRTVRFALPDPDAVAPTQDESAVRLHQLAAPGNGAFVYRYDFGDSWEHLVTVLESRPADGPLPRCIAGAGATPAEDSGGVWGWAEKVRVANEPTDPQHREVRDWLGLADGEVLDPHAFDPVAAGRRLAVLRG